MFRNSCRRLATVGARGHGVGAALVAAARRTAKGTGCEYLHVDFKERLAFFYLGSCEFTATAAELIQL